ncbi:coiled-coil domain-containing protein 146 isoform X2 [Ammospiza nelsoni]|uniref:coiled-coil domain-containing protein 146 isoform X2 n=1 Tax=Ammospiza nelsoni TaxID=2857394 RepID=UPI00286BA722|nr:coiled-coil domain-containing protein 146 isoform X2 [Ammospiza nelsoni]
MSQADEGSAADPELATENESPTGEVAAAAPSEEEQQGPTGLRAEQQEGPTGLTAEEEQGPTGLRAEEEQGPTGLRAEEEEGPTGLKAEEEQGPTGLTAEEEEGPTGLTAEEEQAPTDLTASPAFQCLDELLSAGKITDTRVAELKEQYTLLHEAVISLQESESHLLQEAERLSAELEQQSELEKAEQLSEEAPSEGSQIRQQLFSCRSEYNATKGRVNENRLKIECLREEKKLLEDEYERMSKEKKNDKVQQLKESCDELSEEVIQRKAEIDSMKEAVSSKEKMILTDEEEMKKLQEMHTYLKAELVRILGVPKQLAKETEKLKQKKIDAEKQNEALNDQIEELNSTLRATEKRTEEILQEKKEVMKEMDERQTLIQKNERQCNNLTKSLEINAEKEFAILSDRQILENNLDKCVSENKNQQDILSNHQTKKDKELKSLKKLELQLKSIWDSLEADKATHKRLKSEEMISETDARALEECIAAERSLFKEQEKCRNELATLTRLTLLKADEKQLKSRDVQKAKIQLQSLVKELKRMDSELTICKKMKKENEKEIQGVVKMCELMQIEKDKSIDLMRIAQWKAKEGEHRVKLLENNIENLRHAVMTRERKLQEDYMKIKKNERMKEFIKNDYVKVEQEMLENKEKEKYLHVDSLTAAATHVEKEISQLHKNYERVIEQRNESGLLLREREEEVGVLYEKINRQEVLRRNGETKMQVMDEKISFLKLKLVEKKREVKLCFKELSVKNALDAQLVKVRTQYSQCRDKIKKLEENYGDATNESRKQEMGGKDPSPPELLKRIDKIEAELVQKEQRLLKIDFLCENISDLTDRMRTVVESGRQDMLLFARRSNELQSDINRKTQQIRALFAELSMKQAFALRLQQEIRDKEQSVMTASWMISQGLSPPKAEMDDWKILDSEKIQKAEAEARAEEPPEEEEVALPSYYSTTLEEEEQEEQQEVEEEEQELEQEEQQEEEKGLSSDQVSPGQDI